MVAIWTSPDLEDLLGGPLDSSGLTLAALKRLIEIGAREGPQLDFKRQYPRVKSKDFAKDVAAFANHQGGLILIGMDEVAEVATGIVDSSAGQGADEKWLRQDLANFLRPTAIIDVIHIPTGLGEFLAVVVPPSVTAPHAVLHAGPGQPMRPMVYPERNGTDTRFLDDPEIADRYLRRSTGAREAAMRVAEVAEDGRDNLDRSAEGMWPYIAIVPRRLSPIRLGAAQMRTARDWMHEREHSSPFINDGQFSHAKVMAAPGRAVFTGNVNPFLQQGADKPVGFLLELYPDGSAFVACDIELSSRGERVQGSKTAGVSYLVLVDSLVALTAIAVEWAAHQAGAWGDAPGQVGLHDPQRDGGQPAGSRWMRPVEILSSDPLGGELTMMKNTRQLSRKPAVSPMSFDLALATDVTGRLALAHQAVTALLPWFGIADTDMITARGEIRPQEWGSDQNKQSTSDWAVHNGATINTEPRQIFL